MCSVTSIKSDSVTLWTVAHQAPLSMGLSRKEYWSGVPYPPPGDLASPRVEPMPPVSPALRADSSPTKQYGKSPKVSRTWELW